VRFEVLLAVIAVCAAVSLSTGLLAALYLDQSRAAARVQNGAAALAAARTARSLEPWSTVPRFQIALIDEQAGRLGRARREVNAVLGMDGGDWSAWLVRSRIELRLGDVAAARVSLRRAASLNPGSSLFPSITP
jgi:Tfp pilus assembly protein PilF